jgi:hypothetical protein
MVSEGGRLFGSAEHRPPTALIAQEGLQLVGYTLGLGVVAIALEAVWLRPIAPREVTEACRAPGDPGD